MDGENNGKPYGQMDDLGGKPTIFGNIQIEIEVSYATAARSFMCLGPTDPERVTRSRERLRFHDARIRGCFVSTFGESIWSIKFACLMLGKAKN